MSALPSGWARAQIGDLCDVVNGRAFKPSEWSTTGLPIVRIQNLNKPDAPFNYYPGEVSDRVRIDSGDLLFAWSGTPGTSFGAHVWNRGPAVLNQHIFKLHIQTAVVDRDYFCFAINSKLAELIGKARGGVGLRHLTKGKFEETLVELPPIAEQRRIVVALTDQLNRVNAGRMELREAQALVPQYERALLQKAVTGELTAEWRAEEGVPPAPEVSLGSVAEKMAYGTSAKSSAVGSVPVLRMGNIQNMSLDWTDLVFTSDAKEIDKYRLATGDVLFNRTNSPELVGKTAVYDDSREAIYAGYLIKVSCGPQLLPKYLNYCLNSPLGRDYCRSVKSDGVSQSNINARKLAAFRFQLPSLSEQSTIVKLVEDGLSRIRKISANGGQALSQLDDLERSILERAFRGELVTQDPADEPATSALQRRSTDVQHVEKIVPRRQPRFAKPSPKLDQRSPDMKKRTDVGQNYLEGVLAVLGGSSEAKVLWQRSDMDIDEFYKQLRTEMAMGNIRESKQKERLETNHAS